MNFWGIAQTYTFGRNTHGGDWDSVEEKRKLKFEKEVIKLARIIKDKNVNVKPCLKVKFLFYVMRFMHKNLNLIKRMLSTGSHLVGLTKKRPWKSK